MRGRTLAAHDMRYAALADAYERLAATTKRLEMTDVLVALLRVVPREEIDKVVYLTQGRVFPDYAGIELGLAEKLAIRGIARATARPAEALGAAGEARSLTRTVVGKMRLGVADMTIVDALAATHATKEDRDRVERAYNVSSDLGEVAKALAADGLAGLPGSRL